MGALGVLRVAERLVAQDEAPVGTEVRRAAPGALLGARGEEDLQVGVRRDHRADVASLDHDVPLRAELALPHAHHLAHLRMPRDDGHHAVDLRAADCGRDVDAVDGHALLVLERHGVRARELPELPAVGEVEAALDREPCERAVHRAGVEVAEREPLGEPPGDRALSGPGRPVDSHDHRLVTDSRRSKNPGKLIAAASAPFTSTPSRETSPATAPSIASR